MNCKNCDFPLQETHHYCANCGAKVIRERISMRKLLRDFLNDFFGWDNKYLTTLTSIVTKPDVVFTNYLSGVRKKYVAPFTYLAIGTAFAMLIFNFFSEEYIAVSGAMNSSEYEVINQQLGHNITPEYVEQQRELNIKVQNFFLKYFNIITFLLAPVFAAATRFVFGKPYNYGEHLVITCYIQGTLFLSAIVFFILSIYTIPSLFMASSAVGVFFYLYAYGKLYRLTVGQLFVKFLKFLGIMLVAGLTIVLLGVLVGFLMSFFH